MEGATHEDYDALMKWLTYCLAHELIEETSPEGNAAAHLIRCWSLGLVTIGVVQQP